MNKKLDQNWPSYLGCTKVAVTKHTVPYTRKEEADIRFGKDMEKLTRILAKCQESQANQGVFLLWGNQGKPGADICFQWGPDRVILIKRRMLVESALWLVEIFSMCLRGGDDNLYLPRRIQAQVVHRHTSRHACNGQQPNGPVTSDLSAGTKSTDLSDLRVWDQRSAPATNSCQ